MWRWSILPCGCCKLYNTLSFFSVCIFAQICSTLSWSMDIFKARKFVVVVDQWRVEEDSHCAINKVSWWLDCGGGYILSMKISLGSIFDFGAVDGWIVVFLTRWYVSLSVFLMLSRCWCLLVVIKNRSICCLILWLIFSYQRSWYFSYYQLWYHQCYF